MEAHGWHWTLPAAVTEHAASFASTRALPAVVFQRRDDAARGAAARFHHPYPMAHGLGVVLSRTLASELPGAACLVEWAHPSALCDDFARSALPGPSGRPCAPRGAARAARTLAGLSGEHPVAS